MWIRGLGLAKLSRGASSGLAGKIRQKLLFTTSGFSREVAFQVWVFIGF